MTGAEFTAVASFMGFGAAMSLHQMEEEAKRRRELPVLISQRKPRVRRENGVWICVRTHTSVGWGLTPAAAYRDWCEKLARSEHE